MNDAPHELICRGDKQELMAWKMHQMELLSNPIRSYMFPVHACLSVHVCLMHPQLTRGNRVPFPMERYMGAMLICQKITMKLCMKFYSYIGSFCCISANPFSN